MDYKKQHPPGEEVRRVSYGLVGNGRRILPTIFTEIWEEDDPGEISMT